MTLSHFPSPALHLFLKLPYFTVSLFLPFSSCHLTVTPLLICFLRAELPSLDLVSNGLCVRSGLWPRDFTLGFSPAVGSDLLLASTNVTLIYPLAFPTLPTPPPGPAASSSGPEYARSQDLELQTSLLIVHILPTWCLP